MIESFERMVNEMGKKEKESIITEGRVEGRRESRMDHKIKKRMKK